MRLVFKRLRRDPILQDLDHNPPFSDFNLVIDNHATAVNVSVPVATAAIKFRHSASLDPAPVIAAVEEAAARASVVLTKATEGHPSELSIDHPFVCLCVNVAGASATVAP